MRSIFLPGTIEICRTRFLVTQWMKPEVNPCLTTGSCSTEEKGAWATVLKVSGLKTKNKQELDRIAIVYISRLEGRRRGRGRNYADGAGRPGLGRLNGLLVFVSGASPGEKVRVRIVKLGVRHAEAELVEAHRMATASASA